MNIESQVISLGYAKRLKELKIKQESLFYLIRFKHKCYYCISYLSKSFNDKDSIIKEMYSAFTVSELMDILPASIHEDYQLTIVKLINKPLYGTDYRDWVTNHSFDYSDTEAKTLADSIAKMLIHLIENELIEV